MKLLSLSIALLGSLLPLTFGHGRLRDPPSRSSMWRDGFGNPANYNDHELNCGGFSRQWDLNGGKCGICGDPFDGERQNEAGGKYANGIITKTYTEGDEIVARVEITADHRGWYEFRVCANNDITTPATPECLDRHLLQLADGSGTRYMSTTGRSGNHYIKMKLPRGLTCDQCVFQWKWHSGNNWGSDPATGCSGLGCGPQEEFYGCSDVRILPANGNGGGAEGSSHEGPDDGDSESGSEAASSTERPLTNKTETNPNGVTVGVTEGVEEPRDDGNQQPRTICKSAGKFKNAKGMDEWCEANCAAGFCPRSHCLCQTTYGAPTTTPKPPTSTKQAGPSDCIVHEGRGVYSNDDAVNAFCQVACTFGQCSERYCACASGSGAGPMECVPEAKYANIDGFDKYCASACRIGTCPGCTCLTP